MPGHLKHPSDGELIAELRERGYRVYPEKRVRVFGTLFTLTRNEMYKAENMDFLDKLMAAKNKDAAMRIGVELWASGAVVKTVRDVPDRNREYRSECAIILPRDFDYEREIWEVQHGERPYPKG